MDRNDQNTAEEENIDGVTVGVILVKDLNVKVPVKKI